MKKKSLSKTLKIALPLSVVLGFSVFHFDSIVKGIENIYITIFQQNTNITIIQAPVKPERTQNPPVKEEIIIEESVTPDLESISLNHEYKDSLIKKTDTNSHKFTINSDRGIYITFNKFTKDEASYKLALKDSFGRTLANASISDKDTITQTGKIYLRSGTYTLEIRRKYSWTGRIYSFTVNTFDAYYSEAEDNDSVTRANVIPVNHDIQASTGNADDVDYFAFTLDNLSEISPEFSFKPIKFAPNLKLYTLTITGADTGDSREFKFLGNSKPSRVIKPFTLRAGSYIVSVSREQRDEELDSNIHEYTLRINAR